MESLVNNKKNNGRVNEVSQVESGRDLVKKTLYSTIGHAIDDERQRANQEIAEEMKNGIQQILEAKRSLIEQIVENEKILILKQVLETTQDKILNFRFLKEDNVQIPATEKSATNEKNANPSSITNSHDNATTAEKTELEILPPRDQKAIEKINDFLNSMPESLKVELQTLVDKSVFKVLLREPVDFSERLSSIPEIMNVEKDNEKGQKKIRITLAAKAKWQKDQDQMNDKINEMFGLKN
jgi:hypothetical protein